MTLQLRVILHEKDDHFGEVAVEEDNLLASLVDVLQKEYDVSENDFYLYYNGCDITENEQGLLDAIRHGDPVDIITPQSIVYVDLCCCNCIVTMRVPGYLPFSVIYNTVLQTVEASTEDILCAAGPLSSLDLTKPVFYYNIGSLEPHVDELDDLDLDDDIVNTYQFPCRYSFPCAYTYDKYTLISTQHSLHLYQPVNLPKDYLTGKTNEMLEVPFDKDWKKHVRMMPTPGLFGYYQESRSGEIATVHVRKGTVAGEPNRSTVSYFVDKDLTIREMKEREQRADDASTQNSNSFLQNTAFRSSKSRPPSCSLLSPVLPSDIISRLPPHVAMSEGRESFMRHGLSDLADSLKQAAPSVPMVDDLALAFPPEQSESDVSPSASEQITCKSTASELIDSSSMRKSPTSLSPRGGDAEATSPTGDAGFVPFLLPADSFNVADLGSSVIHYSIRPANRVSRRIESNRSVLAEGDNSEVINVSPNFDPLTANTNKLVDGELRNMCQWLQNATTSKDIQRVSNLYYFLKNKLGDGLTALLSSHPFVHDLATVAVKQIDTDLFDECIKILIDILRDNPNLSQGIVEKIRIDMVINNLKMISTSSIDRIVLFLQFLTVLVNDDAVARDFYSLRGIDALIQVNDSTGSNNVRKQTLELLSELIAHDSPSLAYPAYHAGFQIFQKDADTLIMLLTTMMERLDRRRAELTYSQIVRNDIVNIRMFYSNNDTVLTLCKNYQMLYNDGCKCAIL